jgi:predicted dehydrogenase
VEPESAWGHLARGAELTAVASERGRWDTFYPAFARAVRGEGPLPVDPRDALEVLTVLDASACRCAMISRPASTLVVPVNVAHLKLVHWALFFPADVR